MVADGGVFSPKMDLGGWRVVGRKAGVSFRGSRGTGVGVVDRSSGEETSSELCCLLYEDSPPLEVGLSGDLSGDLLSR